jgi:prepilin-type processing-associated H-X9-DG protein
VQLVKKIALWVAVEILVLGVMFIGIIGGAYAGQKMARVPEYLIGIGIFLVALALTPALLKVQEKVLPNSRKKDRGTLVFLVCLCSGLSFCVYGAFQGARWAGENASCLSNVRNIATAVAMYENENDGLLPFASNWSDATAKYMKEPNTECRLKESPFSYAYNRVLSGASYASIAEPANFVVVFESDAQSANASGGQSDVVPRHMGAYSHVAFADGHAKAIGPYRPMPIFQGPSELGATSEHPNGQPKPKLSERQPSR